MKKIWYFVFPAIFCLLAAIVIFLNYSAKPGPVMSPVGLPDEEPVGPPFTEMENTRWADSILAGMTLEEKIGQLFMVAAYSNRGKEHEQEIINLITKHHLGGLIFMQGGPLRQARLNNLYQSKAKVPLMMSIDGEWGLAMRLDSTTQFPRQMTLGAVQNDSLIYAMGAEIARQCKRIGLHVNFAPVIDINNNPMNPVISNRAFGEEKNMVTRKGIMYMKGLQENGVLANGKHFPGHGDTDSDSHKTLPVVNHPASRIDTLELYPYRELFKRGLGSVMVAHLSIPAYDTTKNTASTLSKRVVDTLLQQELGFEGLIFTDALNMKGVSNFFRPGELDLKAFLAGNDILLFSEDVPVGASLIKTAIEKGMVSEKELDRRVRKLLLAKQWVGLDNYQPVQKKNLYEDLNHVSAEVINRRLVEASITLLKNDKDILPLPVDSLKLASVNLGANKENEFQHTLSLYGQVTHFSLPGNAAESNKSALLSNLGAYDVIILNISGTNNRPHQQFGVSPLVADVIQKLAGQGKMVVVNVPANPYSLAHISNLEKASAVVVSYEDNELTRSYAAQAIFGGIGFKGKLPVTVSPAFRFGMGIQTDAVRMKYTIPEDVGINSKSLRGIDAIVQGGISEKAYPGAQVVVARHGSVIFNKAYGYHTYDNVTPVKTDDIYDIASITKIAGSLPALMELAYENKLDLDKTLGEYLPEARGTNKEKLVLREILAHQAGLKSWIPFYVSTMSNGSYKEGIYSKTKSEEFPNQVASNLYIRKGWQDTILNRILRSPLSDPGKYVYSDLGYYLLQKVVEQVRGEALNVYVEKNFYDPMGMVTTTYRPLDQFPISRIIPTENDQIFRKQVVHGYVHDQGAAMLGGVAGHAGLFSSAHDLAKLMQMYLNGGSFGGRNYLSREVIDEFTMQQFCEENNRRGAGFDRPEPERGGPVCTMASMLSYGHSGFTGTLAWADPETGLVYIFLSNRVYPDAENPKLVRMNIRTKVQEIVYQSVQEDPLLSYYKKPK